MRGAVDGGTFEIAPALTLAVYARSGAADVPIGVNASAERIPGLPDRRTIDFFVKPPVPDALDHAGGEHARA